jgi:hypothetical protein
MKTILTPPLPMRLRLHPPHKDENQFEYVIGMMFEPQDDDHVEVYFSYICTNGNVYNDFDYTPECFIDGMWTDWE